MKRISIQIAALFVFHVFCVEKAGAQVCVGNPAADRELFGELDLTVDYGFRSFGLLTGVNTSGPVTVTLKYELLDYVGIESQGNASAGLVLYELRRPELSVCPFVGVRSSNLEYDYLLRDSVETYSVRSTRIPFGVTLGRLVHLGSRYVIVPSVDVRYVFRVSHVVDTANGRATNTDEEVYVKIRAIAFVGKLYNGLEIGGSTENGDKSLRLFVGVAF